MNIMDPLVRLGPDYRPEPSLARSWEFSSDGLTVTFHLRRDGHWTNGDPVTAHDFVWSWLRTLSPALGKYFGYEFYGIVGAQAYNQCDPEKRDCSALRAKVGLSAPDDYTLQIHLTKPQPWFPRLVTFTPFLAVNKTAVQKYGATWWEPDHIVTDGPFKLVRWVHDKELDLVRWASWRDSKAVQLDQVVGYINEDGDARLREYETGKVDAFPGGYIPLIRGKPGYSIRPVLVTESYVFNLRNVPDVHERRALALAIDRRALASFPDLPASGLTPMGMPGFDMINPASPWLLPAEDLTQARQELAKAGDPKTHLVLAYNKTCPNCEHDSAMIVRAWRKLGIHTTVRSIEWPAYITAMGPPADDKIDIFRQGWFADYPDAYDFLQLAQCDSGLDSSGYCNKAYDDLLKRALVVSDDAEREALYGKAERMLFGVDGAVPLLPIYWERLASLARPNVKGFTISGFTEATYTDLSKVSIGAR